MVKGNRFRTARKVVKSLKAGVGIYTACQAAGISYTAFWNWRHENPKFERLVRYILDSRTQLVEDAMYQNALKGNVQAQIFWLKNKAGWKDSPAIMLNTGTNINTPHAIIFSDIKKESVQPPVKDECPKPRV